MSVPHGWDEITVLRAPLVDSRGTKRRDWSNPTSKSVNGCNVQPASTVQDRDGRLLAIEDGMKLFAPYDADIQAGDRVQFGGATYEVDGSPLHRRSPSGHIDHIECKLVEWSG